MANSKQALAGATVALDAADDYQALAAGATTLLGATGAVGDYLGTLICVVATAATAAVSITDGNGAAISVLPNSPGGGVGTYVIPVKAKCKVGTTPGWRVTTGAGVTVLATGVFT